MSNESYGMRMRRVPLFVVPANADQMQGKMPLHKLRQVRGLSQQSLASRLNVKQPSIAKKERQADMCISTLRSHIAALGGELEIIARFPEGSVSISNFDALEGEPIA